MVSGFMNFNLDILYSCDNYIDIDITHYYRQNGDMIPDPEMILRILKSNLLFSV